VITTTYVRRMDWTCDVCQNLMLHIESAPGKCINSLPERLTAKEAEFLEERVKDFLIGENKSIQVCRSCLATLEAQRAGHLLDLQPDAIVREKEVR
jgi:hypothetical protein